MSRPPPPLRPYVSGVPDDNVRPPAIGELVLLRLPFSMPAPASIISSSAITGSTGFNYHPCVVINVFLYDHDWELNVYVCRAYSEDPNPIHYVSSLPLGDRNFLLPLSFCPSLDGPPGFGSPLSFSGTYHSQRPSWLLAILVNLKMGGNSAYKPFQPRALLPVAERDRIRSWIATVSGIRSNLLPPPLGLEGTGADALRDIGPGDAGPSGAGSDALRGTGPGDAGPGGAGLSGAGADVLSDTDAGLSGAGPRDAGVGSARNASYPMHNIELRAPFREQAAFKFIVGPHEDNGDENDENDNDDNDARSDIFSSEIPFSLEQFQLAAAPNSPYCTEQVARRKAERRDVVQQWISGL